MIENYPKVLLEPPADYKKHTLYIFIIYIDSIFYSVTWCYYKKT